MPYLDPYKRYYVVDNTQTALMRRKRKSANARPAIFLGNILDTLFVGVFSYVFFLFIYPLDWILPELAGLTLASIVFVIKDGPEYSTNFLSDFSDYAKDSLAPRVEVVNRRGSLLGGVTIGWYDLYDEVKRSQSGQVSKAIEPVLKKVTSYGFVLPMLVKAWDLIQKIRFSGIPQKDRFASVVNRIVAKTQSWTVEKQNQQILKDTYFDADVREFVGYYASFRGTVDDLKAEVLQKRSEAIKQATKTLNASLDEEIVKKLNINEIERKINSFIKKGETYKAIDYLAEKISWLDNILNKGQRVKEGTYYPSDFLRENGEKIEAERDFDYVYAKRQRADR